MTVVKLLAPYGAVKFLALATKVGTPKVVAEPKKS